MTDKQLATLLDHLDAHLDVQLDAKFAEQNARIDARFAEQDARFAELDARFAEQDARFAEQDARFDKQDTRFAELEARFDRLEAQLIKRIDQKFEAALAHLTDMIAEQFVAMTLDIEAQFKEMEQRLGDRIEKDSSYARKQFKIIAARDRANRVEHDLFRAALGLPG